MENGRGNGTKEGGKRWAIEVERRQKLGNTVYKKFRREKRKVTKEGARVVEKTEGEGRIKRGERRGKKIEN